MTFRGRRLGSQESLADDPTLKRRLLSQLLVFLILEVAFIALALASFVHPILCNLPLSSPQARAGLTVCFIVWHTIAIMNAENIILHGFSSEWYLRFLKTQKLVPGHTDLVSTITSGLRDRIMYFLSKEASLTYRISFLASWALLALGGIAPGAINLDDVVSFAPASVNATNFTITGGDTYNPILLNPIVRAGLVLGLEQRLNSPFGFATEENMIVGWPNASVTDLAGDLRFDSDVIVFNMSCWWERPSVNMTIWNTTWFAGGYVWYPWNTPLPDLNFFGGMMTMYRFDISQPHPNLDDYPDPFGAVPPVGLSGYIFFGRNSTIPDGFGTKNRTLNLDGLPTLYSPDGFNFTDVEDATGHFQTPLATFLLCDPQAKIMDGTAVLSPNNGSITVLSTTSTERGSAKVGNISPDAANAVLGLSMMDGMEVDDYTAEMRVGALAASALLNDSSLNFATDSGGGGFDIAILPLDDIQRNLTKCLNSAAKAFSSYVRDYDKEPSPDAELFVVGVQGTVASSRAALVASKGLMITMIVLDVFIALVLVVECSLLKVWKVPGFKLENLIKYGQLASSGKERSLSDISIIMSDDDRPQLGKLFLHLLGFLVLEASFSALVFFCISSPLFISLPLSAAEVKGGFTVLFILWHSLAVFLISYVTSFAFSSEWSRQRHRMDLLVPGFNDRVSRLTSGSNDRARYFFGAAKPSLIFRVAFIASLTMAGLTFFAPGSLSVNTVTRDVQMNVNVANLEGVSGRGSENSHNLDVLTDRTFTFGMMEQHEDTVFQFDVQPNWLMAWPDKNSVKGVTGYIEYPTDVVAFKHNCTWSLPQMESGEDTTWIIDGRIWELWDDPLPDFPYRGGILPLYRDLDLQPDAKTAYLLIGTNDSFPVSNDTEKWSIINLSGLPTQLHDSGLTINDSNTGTSHWIPPLSTILVCDPQAAISGGRARLSINGKLEVRHSGDPPIGNIPLEAANTIFTHSLISTLDVWDEILVMWTTILSARVFLSDTSMEYDNFPRGVPVNDLAIINTNLDSFFLSSSKAFTDGLRVDAADQSKIVPQTISVGGIGQVDQLALVGAKQLGIVSFCLWAFGAMMFAWLMWLVIRDEGVAFDLEHLVDVLDSDDVSEKTWGFKCRIADA